MNLELKEIPAVYINLKKDVDKNESMKSMLNQCGFNNIIRVNAEHTPDNPLAGCSLSHYNALSEVDPPFIVFEDDCKVKSFRSSVEIPDDSEAIYLGISSWGRMNSHSGPFVQCENIGFGMVRIYNMLSAHSVLYLDEEYTSLCRRISYNSYETAQHQDIGFAEIQRYYNVYAFNDPLFYQTSSNGTDEQLTSYPSYEVLQPHRTYWKPTSLY
tara:strand:- start:1722 stop:2360 length:639 start_codon:yes stop_codon:yes gene_type:complete